MKVASDQLDRSLEEFGANLSWIGALCCPTGIHRPIEELTWCVISTGIRLT